LTNTRYFQKFKHDCDFLNDILIQIFFLNFGHRHMFETSEFGCLLTSTETSNTNHPRTKYLTNLEDFSDIFIILNQTQLICISTKSLFPSKKLSMRTRLLSGLRSLLYLHNSLIEFFGSWSTNSLFCSNW
jgi:hypothetical protein